MFRFLQALKLSSSAKRKTTTGEIVNLMSVDAQKIQEGLQFIHTPWSTPTILIVALILLWNEIGVASLAGMVVLLILLPGNAFGLGTVIKNLQVISESALNRHICGLCLSLSDYTESVYM